MTNKRKYQNHKLVPTKQNNHPHPQKMIDPNRLRPKISPFEWYRLGSGILFIVLGGYLIFRYIFTPAIKRFVPPIILGGIILIYGFFRLLMSYRNIRRSSKNQKDTEDKKNEE